MSDSYTDEEIRAEIFMMARAGDPWARMWRAVERGTGVRFTASDVVRLGSDDALGTNALEEAVRRLDAEADS